MIKKLHTYSIGLLLKAILCLSILVALGTTKSMAQFAVSEDFRGAGNPDIIIGDNAYLTSGNGDPVNGGWLRLTSATTYQKGFAYVDRSFPSTLGVLVDFEYKTWRDVNDGYNGADGIGVFLFNGDASNTFSLGGYGGSLGYAPNGVGGLNGGYVGIGLDEYGNFSNATEGRNGGPGERPNAIVLRGPTTSNAGTTNPYLAGTTIRTTDGGATFTYSTTATGVTSQNALDYNTVTSTRPTDSQFYRRIQIKIERLTTGGQYKITVRWKTTPTGAFVDVTSYTTTDVPPALLKLGFAASTGGGVNYHEIRNLLVTTPNNMRVKKTANKDFIRTVAGSGSENQITYTIEITNDTAEPVYNIDFVDRITDADGNLIPKYVATPTVNGFQITSVSASGFTSGTPTVSALTNTITGTFAMPANSVATITVTGTLRGYTPSGNLVVNTATATPPYDDDLNNNTSIVETPVLAEGIDIVPTHTVDENCADGSNTFTVNVSNIGVEDASISTGNGNSTRRLRVFITAPQPTGGFGITWNNINGWSLQSTTDNTLAGTRTYEYRSNNSATIASGQAYNYPIVYTITKTGAATAYTTTAEARYTNNNGSNNLEPTDARDNNSASVSIVSIPTAPTANNVYYCLGETASPLTATASPGNVLKWYFSATGGFSSDYAPTPLTDVAGVQSYWVTQTRGTCESQRRQIYVYVSPTPTPGSIAADQYFCNGGGDPALLTSVTAGTNGTSSGMTFAAVAYQWQISTDNASWTDISGATAATYDPPAITATRYYRRVTVSTNTTNGGSYKCYSVPTNVVTVLVSVTPTAGTIAASQTICYNTAPALLTSSTPGAGTGTITYAWQSSTNSGGSWSGDISGANGPTYQPGALTQTTQFRRITIATSGTAICRSAGSTAVTITVQGQINAGTIGSDQSICSGATPSTLTSGSAATVSPSLSGTTIAYRWEYSTDGGTTWTTAPGTGTNATYAFPGGISASRLYRRMAVVTANSRSCESPSGTIAINVVTPTAGSIAANQTICYNTQPSLFTSATGGAGTGPGTGVTYQWYDSSDNNNFNAISGATSETYQVLGNLTTTRYYRRRTVSNTNGTSCSSVDTNTITVTVIQDPSGFQTGNLAAYNLYVCPGEAYPTLASQNAGSVPSPGVVGYQWQILVGSTWTNISGATSASYTPSGIPTATTGFRRLVTGTFNGVMCTRTDYGPEAYVNVRNAPGGGSIGTSATICSGTQPPTITNLISGSNAYNYVWQYSTDGTNWTTNTSQISSDYTFSAPITQTMHFRRFGTNECVGTSPSNVVVYTVPTPANPGTIGSDQLNVCRNTLPALLTSINDGSGGSGYQWQISDGVNGPWNNITGATSATYQPDPVETKYFRRLTIYNSGSCTIGSNVVRITSTVTMSAGSINGNETVCSNAIPSTILSSDGGYSGSYRWDSSVDGTNWTSTGITTQTYVFSAPLATTTYYRRTMVGTSCVGEMYSNIVTKTVIPSAVGGTAQSNQTVCSDVAPSQLTVSGASTGNYLWYVSTNGISWISTGVTTADYSPGVLPATRYFRRGTTLTTCSGEAYSSTVIITVKAAVNGGTASSNQNICNGGTTSTLSVAGADTGTYRWESSTTSATGPWASATGTFNTATYAPGTLAQTTYYRRVTTSGSCDGYSNVVTISVSDVPMSGSLTANQNICMDNAPAVIGPGTPGTGSGTITYIWESSPNGTTGWTVIAGATSASYQPPVIHSTTYYRRTTVATSTVSGNTVQCQSAPTSAVTVETRNCKVITNPMIRSKVN